MMEAKESLLEDIVANEDFDSEGYVRPVPKIPWWLFVFYFLGFKKPLVADQAKNTHDNPEVWPEQSTNFLSRLTFSFFGSLLFAGFYRPLEHTDLWQLHTQDTSKACMDKFTKNWLKDRPSLLKALHHSFGWKFYSAVFPKFIYDCLQFADPVLLSLIISFLGEEGDDRHSLWYGFGLVAILFFIYVTKTLLINQYFHIGFRTGIHLRNAVITSVFEKSLVLSNKSRKEQTSGAIIDLMSNDASRLQNITSYLHMLWSAPFQICIALAMLFRLIGVSTFAGLLYMILLIPLNSFVLKKQKQIRAKMVNKTDERVKWTNEVLQAIRAVKLYCYEGKFIEMILEVRNLELTQLLIKAFIGAFNRWVSATAPVVVCALSLSCYVLLGNPLTADVIFPAISLFNLLRFPLSIFPNMVTSAAECLVSIRRIQAFLLAEELIPLPMLENIPPGPEGEEISLSIQGNFSWDPIEETSNMTLKQLNLNVKKGSVVGIIGPVGAGKSSLVSVPFGELYPDSNAIVGIQGSTSLVPQQPWIMNSTLRENILFGLPFDPQRYHPILEACALLPDLAQLAAGDMTEIGEKGINLSGGQKQRVSIARAVYQNSDIYIMDDPLSAVDTHVARHIFENVICGLLKGKTVLLVTHYLHLLPRVDYVISMQDGRIAEAGEYRTLLGNNGDFASLIRDYSTSKHDDEESEDELVEKESKNETALVDVQLEKKEQPKGKLMENEERETGAVKLRMYYEYAKSAGSLVFFTLIILGAIFSQATKMLTDWWISYWTQDPDFVYHNLAFYFGLYLSWAALNSLIIGFTSFLVAYTGVRCSKNLHNDLLRNMLRAPMRFFESTPLGRIINRFAKDLDNIDSSLPDTWNSYLSTVCTCFGSLALICVITPVAILGLVPLMYLYYRVQEYYRATSRELKRLDSISKSPIFAHFSETLSGISSIRAYNSITRFINLNEFKLDYNNRAYLCIVTANRWLSIRLEFVSTSILIVSALLVIVERNWLSPSTAGLLLSYTLGFTTWLAWFVRVTADMEQQMNSIERVVHYSRLEQEGPFEIQLPSSTSWPTRGEIIFDQVTLKYRAGLSQNALNNVSFQIQPREKIGVAGRTGAGKSSLLVALFRLVELYSGRILIDGMDIAKLGLTTLRSGLVIIPQDPVLFTGDIRTNLDPFKEHSDAEIWNALEMVQMKNFVESIPEQLGHKVSSTGGFSVGQRQLLSFARALLGDVKILLLDEATASCDMETDHLIQLTLREKFAHCTVITIAHRLNTIMDADRILVMEAGMVAEFDEPFTLLSNSSSHLSRMVQETGDAADHLRSIAERKHNQGSQMLPVLSPYDL